MQISTILPQNLTRRVKFYPGEHKLTVDHLIFFSDPEGIPTQDEVYADLTLVPTPENLFQSLSPQQQTNQNLDTFNESDMTISRNRISNRPHQLDMTQFLQWAELPCKTFC